MVNPFNAIAQTSQLAQNSPDRLPPINCQEDRDTHIQANLSTLKDKARQYANAKNKEKAAQTLAQVLRNVRCLENGWLKAFALEEILDLEMRSSYSRLVADTVDLYIAAGRKQQAVPMLADALQTVQTLSTPQGNAKIKSLVSLASHYRAIGQTTQAFKILEQSVQTSKSIEGTEFKMQALATIAQGYIAAGKFEQASELIAQLLDYTKTFENEIPPDSYLYPQGELLANLAASYAKARQYNQALQIAQLITKSPSDKLRALSAIALESAQQGELELALATVQMIEARQDTFEAKARLLAEIGSKYVQAGKPDKAAQVFAEALQTWQTWQTGENILNELWQVSEIIIKYAQSGQPNAASELVPNIPSNGFPKARALAAIALSYAKAGLEAKASQTLSETLATIAATSDEYHKLDARREAIRNFVEAKRFDLASLVAQPIEDELSRAETLKDIAVQAADAGQTELAVQMVQVIGTQFFGYTNAVLYQVALAHVKALQYDKALQVAKILDNRTVYPAKTLAAIATGLFKAGQSQRVSKLFTLSVQAANAIEDINAKIPALGAVALEYANTQQLTLASKTVSQAVQVAQTLEEPYLQSAALRLTAEEFIRAKHYDLALLVAQAMKEEYERSSILEGIFVKSMQAEDYEEAHHLVTFLETPERKARWLIAMARQYIQMGNIKGSSQLLSQALQVTRTISGPESKTLVFGTEPTVTVVEDDSDRGSFLEAIAVEYAKAGQHTQAQLVAKLLKDNATRTRLNQRLACYQRR
jgi:lipopolysaccharide biosynthesis regulator YciM